MRHIPDKMAIKNESLCLICNKNFGGDMVDLHMFDFHNLYLHPHDLIGNPTKFKYCWISHQRVIR